MKRQDELKRLMKGQSDLCLQLRSLPQNLPEKS